MRNCGIDDTQCLFCIEHVYVVYVEGTILKSEVRDLQNLKKIFDMANTIL